MRALALSGWLVAAACSQAPTTAPAGKAPARAVPIGESNIARADYVGPDACGECHPTQHALWSASLHRVMNAQAGDAGAVIGDFSGAVVRYRGGEVRFDRDLTGYLVTTKLGDTAVRYRVTRTIGRRGLQEYVGIEEGRTEEVRLPFGWWPRAGGWSPQVAFDPWLDEASFDPFRPVREPWAERCPWCHSTYPFAQRIARASGPREVGHGLEQYFTSAPGSDRLAVAEQVTTGISCESCHLGGRAHAAGAGITAIPQAPRREGAPALPETFAEQRADATVVNTICAQCHSGPSPRLSDGTALRNSSEALDLGASSCKAKCTDCHDPHVADSRGDEAKAVKACIGCHETFAAPEHAGQGHTTTTCLDCHMPRLVMGIDRYVRTHRISSPTNAALLAEGAPNACNLCHLDRPIAWTRGELRAGWTVRLPASIEDAYGDAAVGDVWLASKTPAIRLVAAHAYARSPLGRYALDALRRGLTDPLPYVRAWMQLALDEIRR